MNKKFAEFFSGLGAAVDGNSAHGTVNGFEAAFVIDMFSGRAPLKMHIAFYATDEQRGSIVRLLQARGIKMCSLQGTAYGMRFELNDMTTGALIKRMPSVLNTVCEVIKENGGLGSEYCPVCGKPLSDANCRKVTIDGFAVTLHGECVAAVNAAITAENAAFAAAPDNLLRGFCGALIGGLLGAAFSVLMYVLGFISSLSAIISVVLGAFLYEKLGGKPNKKMVAIVSVTTVVFMVASIVGTYVVASGMTAAKQGLSMSAFEAFRIVMKDSEVSRMFYADLALVLLFTAIGVGVEIYILAKKIKRTKNIQ